uniref:Uncharacterized protein n=1 Tax=Hofstenia miamia TaxID=442651 RepID=A0A5P8I4M7_HOFMI|nr:hypothetical protein [Hofstenia miamia]
MQKSVTMHSTLFFTIFLLIHTVHSQLQPCSSDADCDITSANYTIKIGKCCNDSCCKEPTYSEREHPDNSLTGAIIGMCFLAVLCISCILFWPLCNKLNSYCRQNSSETFSSGNRPAMVERQPLQNGEKVPEKDNLLTDIQCK